jgi:hypothetical protein
LLDTLSPEFIEHFLEDLQVLQKHLLQNTKWLKQVCKQWL